jgi:6-phosphogluconolactonase (cycloisomerase 2 family)
MKIIGCGLGLPARRAGVSPAGFCRSHVRVAERRPSVCSRVGVGAVGILALALTACGGGGGSTPSNSGSPPPAQFSIGGTVSGLTGTGLVLQDNGGDNLAVSANGSFTFATKVNSGGAYAVTVMTQPSGQTCSVASGSGTASGNVTNVAVTCSSSSVTIGGAVSGLAGTGLVLQDNGGDNLSVTNNGSFTFATALATGKAYAVTVATQPSSPNQTCTVTNGTGTTGSSNVTNVTVSCITSAGKFAYTAVNTTGKIYAFTIDSNTGALTQVGTNPDGATPAAVSLAPNGKFAFSASDNGLQIHAFTIDQTTGVLTEVTGSPYSTGFTTGSSYPDIAVSAQSTYLYLASAGDAKVAGFSIDQTTGQLTALAGSPYNSGPNASGIPAFSPDNKHLYVLDNNTTGGVYGYSVDSNTGVLTPISGSSFPTGPSPYWITFTPNGNFAYVANSGASTISAFAVNSTTGALTPLTPTATFAADGNPKDLTIDSTGTHLYAPVSLGSSNGEVDVFTINSDGSLTAVAGSPWAVGIGPRFVNIDPTGRFAYVSSAGTGGTGVYGFTIDSTTGALTPMAGNPFHTGSEPQFITVDPSGKFGYTADQGSGTITGFAIDQTTGALTATPNSPYTVGGNPFFLSISPEAPGIRD